MKGSNYRGEMQPAIVFVDDDHDTINQNMGNHPSQEKMTAKGISSIPSLKNSMEEWVRQSERRAMKRMLEQISMGGLKKKNAMEKDPERKRERKRKALERICERLNNVHMEDPSPSQCLSLKDPQHTWFDTGNPSTSGRYDPALNAYGTETGNIGQSAPREVLQELHIDVERDNSSGDANTSMEQSPQWEEDPKEVDADTENANRNGDATASTEQLPPGEDPQEVRVDIGRANSNGERTADQSAEYWLNEARNVRRLSVAVGVATSSNVVKASCATGYFFSEAATWLRGTAGEAATPNVVKIAKVACALGVLADMGKELPIEYIGATILAILIPIAVMVFAQRQA